MEQSGLNIFISHRHDDQDFADVLRKRLNEWGFVNIFQSSDPKSGITTGASIDESIRGQLANCHLFIHIYTDGSADWSWCIREIGVAEAQGDRIQIVVFQMFEDEMKFRQDKFKITLTEEDIERFVRDIFGKDQFFPGVGPVWPVIEEEGQDRQAQETYIENQVRQLHIELQDTAIESLEKRNTVSLEPIKKKEDLKIFISCRDSDLNIGKVIRDQIRNWGFTVMMSPVEGTGDQEKRILESDVHRFLWQCHLLILVFTRADVQWNRCLFEIGTANEEQVPTHLTIFRIFDDHPSSVFEDWIPGDVVDTRDEEEIGHFIKDLFYKPNFFLGYEAIQPEENLSTMTKKGWEVFFQEETQSLLEELEQVRSAVVHVETHETVKSMPRWGYFKLVLSEGLYRECTKYGDKDKIVEKLRSSLQAIESDGWGGLAHFGYANSQQTIEEADGLTLDEIFATWKGIIGDQESNMNWADELVGEIWAFRTGVGGFDLSWKPFLSAYPGSRGQYYIYPIVCGVEIFQNESRVYQVYTFQVPTP